MLFRSTTGKPKGIVRDNGGHAVALRWSLENIYDTKPGEVFWAASDVGWVVGHSYIIYGPLLTGCTTVSLDEPQRLCAPGGANTSPRSGDYACPEYAPPPAPAYVPPPREVEPARAAPAASPPAAPDRAS